MTTRAAGNRTISLGLGNPAVLSYQPIEGATAVCFFHFRIREAESTIDATMPRSFLLSVPATYNIASGATEQWSYCPNLNSNALPPPKAREGHTATVKTV